MPLGQDVREKVAGFIKQAESGGACSCYLQLVYLPEVLQIDVHPESDPTFGAHSP